MVAKKVEAGTCCPSKNHKVIFGIITILLGLGVWFNYFSVAQFLGIVFVLLGLKVLFFKHCHPC